MTKDDLKNPRGERRCMVGVGSQGENTFEPFVRAAWADAEITQLRGNLSLAEDGLAAAMQDIERLNLKCGALAFLLYGSPGEPKATPFDAAAILAAPRERRISMSFETQEQYEAAVAFLDMGDTPEKVAPEPSGCPEHGMEHFFEGMCIKCGVVPAVKSAEGQYCVVHNTMECPFCQPPSQRTNEQS
jgi:hypothetical protein